MAGAVPVQGKQVFWYPAYPASIALPDTKQVFWYPAYPASIALPDTPTYPFDPITHDYR